MAMFECDNCGKSLNEFMLKEIPITIDGVKYFAKCFECPKCNKQYVVSISVGDVRKEWMNLIDAEQMLKEVSHDCPSDEQNIKQLNDTIEIITNNIKHMARKGQKLMSILNIR